MQARSGNFACAWNVLCCGTVAGFDTDMQFELNGQDTGRHPALEYPNTYAPIPANGASCIHTGLKHAHMYKLLSDEGGARSFVRVVNLKTPKARHGKTLFNIGDMLRYLDHLAQQQGSGESRHSLVPSDASGAPASSNGPKTAPPGNA